MTWKLYRVLNDNNEQLPIDTELTYDPDTRLVRAPDGVIEQAQDGVIAFKDGRQIAVLRRDGHPGLRFCFEASPALLKEFTERAAGIRAHLEDILPDTTQYNATLRECYEQGGDVYVVFDVDHEDGQGLVVSASLDQPEFEDELIREISNLQCEIFEGYNPDEEFDYPDEEFDH